MEGKRCPKCGEVWPIVEKYWYMSKKFVGGYIAKRPTGYCKPCQKQYQNERNAKLKVLKQEYEDRMKEALQTYKPEPIGPPLEELPSVWVPAVRTTPTDAEIEALAEDQ